MPPPQRIAAAAFILVRMRKDLIERLWRGLYSVALYLLAPVTVYHLIWRGFRQPAYFQRWLERYAVYRGPAQARTLWLHAVSVGEVRRSLRAGSCSASYMRAMERAELRMAGCLVTSAMRSPLI